MTAIVVQGKAQHLPLPDASVDLVVTSPPYFALRAYQDGGETYAGQIGSEASPQEFLEALWACTREWMRVLKPSGSLFVNLGDKYSGARQQSSGRQSDTSSSDYWKRTDPKRTGIPAKSLMGLPWRYAIGCIDQLGLILRAELVWAKPNCLSGGTMLYAKVKGRPTTIKVHDLCRAYAPEDVQLWNGQRWTQVLWWQPTGRHEDAAESYKAIRAARRRGDEPVVGGDIEIELRSGERIGCTREHRWPTSRGLIHAADLQVGDVLETCPMPEGEITPTGLDDETVGWFVGLYVAEGSRSEGTIQLAGHVKELERYKRLRDLSDAYHGTCKVHATGGNTATINLTGRFLDAMLDTYVGGKTAKDKHLRPACWQRSNRFLRAVLAGYLSGDGHWREDARKWILGFTDNDYLAADLRSIGARLGLSVRLSRCTHTGFGREWPGWRGDILEPDRRRKPDSEIVAIRQSRARQFWDIGVADDPHLFALASGVLTHNSLPESVTDRVRRSHEQFFHFTLQPRYFSGVDEIREQAQQQRPQAVRAQQLAARHGLTDAHRDALLARGLGDTGRSAAVQSGTGKNSDEVLRLAEEADRALGGYAREFTMTSQSLGKLPGSVWEIPSEPLTVPAHLGVDHFAAFPTAWPKRLILGWSPAGICTACGEGRRPVAHSWRDAPVPVRDTPSRFRSPFGRQNGHKDAATTEITGYACACPDTSAPTRPSVILDPFGGTGTTAAVASALGRIGISVDLSHDYSRLAQWRTTDPATRAKIRGERPPVKQADGQLGIFDGLEVAG